MIVDVGADVYWNLDKFCSGIFKVCVKCMSEYRNVYVVACRKKKKGRHVAINMLTSSTGSVGSWCLVFGMRRWHSCWKLINRNG
jgi:hypothetical protein